MRKLISFRFAINASLLIYGLFIVFHFAIIMGILIFKNFPIQYFWGGRMQNKEQLLVFEIISILLMSFCIFVVLIKSKKIYAPKLLKFSTFLLWILFVLFTLNTIGNIFAKTLFENYFTVVTAFIAILCLRIVIEKKKYKIYK